MNDELKNLTFEQRAMVEEETRAIARTFYSDCTWDELSHYSRTLCYEVSLASLRRHGKLPEGFNEEAEFQQQAAESLAGLDAMDDVTAGFNEDDLNEEAEFQQQAAECLAGLDAMDAVTADFNEDEVSSLASLRRHGKLPEGYRDGIAGQRYITYSMSDTNIREMIEAETKISNAINKAVEDFLTKLETARKGMAPTIRNTARGVIGESLTGFEVEGEELIIIYSIMWRSGDTDQETLNVPLTLIDDPTDEGITAYLKAIDDATFEAERLKVEAERLKKEQDAADKRANDLAQLRELAAKYPGEVLPQD